MATCSFLTDPFLAFVRLQEPVLLEDFCEIRKPTRFLAILLGPTDSGPQLVEQARALGTLLTDQLFCQLSAYRAETTSSLVAGLTTFLGELTVLPPAAWDPKIRLDPPTTTQSVQTRYVMLLCCRCTTFCRMVHRATMKEKTRSVAENGDDQDDPDADDDGQGLYARMETVDHMEDESLQFTGRLFGGLVLDVKRKLPWYFSDFKDAFHGQTLASVMYIYLATVTKAITFGGFLGDITDGLQGVQESFLGHLLAGGVFCLFGGQPLTVLGCTGPVSLDFKCHFNLFRTGAHI